jgi:hypothetical protein
MDDEFEGITVAIEIGFDDLNLIARISERTESTLELREDSEAPHTSRF